VPVKLRTVPCSKDEARVRLATAQAYLEVARAVLQERPASEYRNVSAGVAVLAGVAAADAICGLRLGCLHRGDDHRGAAELIRGATNDGAKLAAQLQRLLSLKDAAHYGMALVSARNTTDAVKWAAFLVQRAAEESER
jgi:hypothetical protein